VAVSLSECQADPSGRQIAALSSLAMYVEIYLAIYKGIYVATCQAMCPASAWIIVTRSLATL
jgi:hypothetical protein